MTGKAKFDKRVVRSIMWELDKLARKHGQIVTRYAVKRWDAWLAAEKRFIKQRRELRAKLREIERKTRG